MHPFRNTVFDRDLTLVATVRCLQARDGNGWRDPRSSSSCTGVRSRLYRGVGMAAGVLAMARPCRWPPAHTIVGPKLASTGLSEMKSCFSSLLLPFLLLAQANSTSAALLVHMLERNSNQDSLHPCQQPLGPGRAQKASTY